MRRFRQLGQNVARLNLLLVFNAKNGVGRQVIASELVSVFVSDVDARLLDVKVQVADYALLNAGLLVNVLFNCRVVNVLKVHVTVVFRDNRLRVSVKQGSDDRVGLDNLAFLNLKN